MNAPARTLIVTGDDFGFSSAINAAVIQAHREGILTSASLMVNGEAFEEAVSLARQHPDLEVGLHVSLVRSRATLDHRLVPDLVDRTGCLPEAPVSAGFRFYFERRLRHQLQAEIEAQIQKFFDSGLRPTHLDGHLHFHVHPTVLEILLPLMARYAIPSIRLPREDMSINRRIDPGRFWHQSFLSLVYSRLSGRALRKLARQKVLYPDRFFGLLASGRMNEAYLLGVIDRLGPGFTEIGFHPALGPPPELARWTSGYRFREELDALCSARVRDRLREEGIALGGYRELQKTSFLPT
jgi:hopanoid biosynthesis associated protein HpnK